MNGETEIAALVDISNLIRDYTFGLYTTDECWVRVNSVVDEANGLTSCEPQRNDGNEQIF